MRTTWTPNDFIVEGDICKIGLYNGKSEFVCYAVIDTIDMERCEQYKWCFSGGYVIVGTPRMHLHHFILGTKPSKFVKGDHINRNTLDNRRSNLRVATCSENSCNMGPVKNKSGYKGVGWNETDKVWKAGVTKDGVCHYIGRFKYKDDAARAYNKLALELHGEFAYQNVIKPVLKRVPNSKLSL